MDLANLTITDFEPLLNRTFHLQLPDSTALEAELIEVSKMGPPPVPESGRTRQAFSLIFRGPGEVALPQAIYRLETEALEPLDLFLVPAGPERATGKVLYEALFS